VLALALGWASFCCGQTVQLPTFQFFTVNTTVSVPDRGGAFLGGVNRASYGTTSRSVPGLGRLPVAGRLFGNRGIGNSISSSGVHATATIIDHREIDEAILSQAGGRGQPLSLGGDLDARARYLAQHVARNDAYAQPPRPPVRNRSVAAAGVQHQAASIDRQREASDFYRRAEQLEADGKSNVAVIYYRMAGRQATGELREQALSRLAALSGASTATRVATRRP
jgi:hypothetical protein